MHARHALAIGACFAALAVSLPGCGASGAAGPRTSAREGQLITAEMIREAGASNGWDVLRRFASHLTLTETAAGQSVSARRRGRSSIYLREPLLLIVDGVRVGDVRALETMPARDIASLRILSGQQGSIRYGGRAANGTIVVETVRP